MNRVREYRQRLGLSQEELSRITGIPRTTISSIESGSVMPSVDYALRLARAFGCSVEELFSQEEYKFFPGFKEGLFISYLVGSQRVIAPAPMEHVDADGFYKDEKISWFKRLNIPTFAFAGCDNSLKLLTGTLLQEGIRLLTINASSLKALELLKEGYVHMAGLHMGCFEENYRLVKEHLGRGYKVLKVFSWEEGILTREMASLKELKKRLWLAREEGSGARKVFEEIREDIGIKKYKVVHADHEKVAFAIKEGLAEAGVGTKVYAYSYGLEFFTIKTEDYCLCYREDLEEDKSFLRLLNLLKSKTYRNLISQVPGYRPEVGVEEALT
ncbi:MAG TPA: transcriptional regulator [Aquificaceae bacterium]|nr:transcriptional regulator [Aquificaceae bacterium]